MPTGDDPWDEMFRQHPDVAVTATVLRQGAASLTHHLWRNTEAVEDWAHAEGPWHDHDMLRINTLATYHALEALRTVLAGESSAVEAFDVLSDAWLDLMPSRELRERAAEDGHIAAGVEIWGEAIDAHGLGRVLTVLIDNMWWVAPDEWWLMPGYAGLVAELAELDPPDPSSFTTRMRLRPWELTDEQARFVVDHRYRSARNERRGTPDQ